MEINPVKSYTLPHKRWLSFIDVFVVLDIFSYYVLLIISLGEA